MTSFYETLLAGLDNCRWNYLRGLADAAEDEGRLDLARGWRWLADHRKWPMGWRGGFRFEMNSALVPKKAEYGLPLVMYKAVRKALKANETGAEDLELRSWGGRDGLAKFMAVVAEAIGERLGHPCPPRSRESGQS